MIRNETEVWPIFQVQDNLQSESFWNKKAFKIKCDTIMKGQLTRIGKKKQAPQKYQYQLLENGVLIYYEQENMKGWIQLNLLIIIKKIDLTNQEVPNQKITTIRIERFKKCLVYLFCEDNQIATNHWYKKLAQFCVSQNFDGFYKLNETIDQGAFTTVFSVSPIFPEDLNSKKFAAKVYSKQLQQRIPPKQMKTFIMSECEVLKLIKSDYVIELFEVIQLEDVVILIFEHIARGTLSNLIKQDQINEYIACQICFQISQGLKEIHNAGYVHRDIKLDNVMITQLNPITIKIIDFGFSEKINRIKLLNGQGTAGYIAPELFELTPYTENCDLFSLGVLFYILLSGSFPFRTSNYETLLDRNKQCQIKFYSDEWKNISSSAQRMVQRMLEKDPIKRMTQSELMILLELHIANMKQQQTRSTLNPTQSSGQTIQQNKIRAISFEIVEKSPFKLIQAIKQTQIDDNDEDFNIEDNSIETIKIASLQHSSSYYNKSKWIN